jgi:hypothetical protein
MAEIVHHMAEIVHPGAPKATFTGTASDYQGPFGGKITLVT